MSEWKTKCTCARTSFEAEEQLIVHSDTCPLWNPEQWQLWDELNQCWTSCPKCGSVQFQYAWELNAQMTCMGCGRIYIRIKDIDQKLIVPGKSSVDEFWINICSIVGTAIGFVIAMTPFILFIWILRIVKIIP